MPFWTKNHSEDATLRDPKRKFRFIVNFDGISGENATAWYAKAASKPSFQIGAAEHKYLNHTFFYPGSVTKKKKKCTFSHCLFCLFHTVSVLQPPLVTVNRSTGVKS